MEECYGARRTCGCSGFSGPSHHVLFSLCARSRAWSPVVSMTHAPRQWTEIANPKGGNSKDFERRYAKRPQKVRAKKGDRRARDASRLARPFCSMPFAFTVASRASSSSCACVPLFCVFVCLLFPCFLSSLSCFPSLALACPSLAGWDCRFCSGLLASCYVRVCTVYTVICLVTLVSRVSLHHQKVMSGC